ncbi:unnamed protein product [Urochloa humidicola]
MSSKAAEMLGHPPGVKFCPDDDELVEFFLLPRVRGEPSWFPSVLVINDDTAANTNPSKLLERHGLAGDNNAYFFVNTSGAAGRQDRHCTGGGRWVSQKPEPKVACIGGQEITWRRVNLNFQTSRGKTGGGSNGWVMHEYSLIEPPYPFLKICHVTLSGHGKDSIIKRVPAGEAGCQADEPAPKRARVAAAAANNSGSSKTKMISDQEPPSVVAHASSSTSQVYGSTAPVMDQGMSSSNQQLLGYGAYSSAAAAHACAGQEPAQSTDEETLDWFRVHGNDLLADAAEPTAEHSMVPQMRTSGEDEGISPMSNQQLLDGIGLPAEERLQNTTDQVIQDAQVMDLLWIF